MERIRGKSLIFDASRRDDEDVQRRIETIIYKLVRTSSRFSNMKEARLDVVSLFARTLFSWRQETWFQLGA